SSKYPIKPHIPMNIYLAIILFILIGQYFLDLVIDLLNVRTLQTDLPVEFEGVYDAEKYKKSQEYLKDNTRLGIIGDSVNTPAIIAFILLGGFNLVDRFARSFELGPIPTGLIFAAALLLAFYIFNIPFSIYSTFVIEEKYGFNRTTPKTYILDILKGGILVAVIGSIILSGVLWFFARAGSWAWIICWLAVFLFQVFLMFLAPVLIMPIFNKFTPIEEGELKETVETYAKAQGFKIKGLFTMDGSKRSTKSNAFFTGFGKYRRIVLFDTLIDRHTVDELVAVLAHEMGHYKKGHILKALFISFITTGFLFYILSIFMNSKGLFAAFRMEEISLYAGLFFFGFLYTPIEMVLSVFGHMLSRKHEYEADAYAVETFGRPEAMITALKKLSVDNLSNLTPHPLKVFMSYSHPPVLDRIKAIRNMGAGAGNYSLL
ncbi:MAG: M48 family metallopeptidase, partial [Pseudomonadota bacterium]